MPLSFSRSARIVRRTSAARVGRRRNLKMEVMEQRVVMSANPLVYGDAEAPIETKPHFTDAYELHAMTALPNQAADPVNPEDRLSTETPASLSETFALHSNPGASKTIYLDFDGHVTSGTIWNSNYNGGADIVTPAYDFDGDASSFSDGELQRIQWIWERVAEDFIPFDVDVTTEDPGVGALVKSGSSDTQWGTRAVIGGSSSDWWGSAAGGVAYVGSFNWSYDSPAFVFEAQLGNGNEKYTAEAISHEVGHALGLSHDGRTSPSEEYFKGQGSGETGWAPIMGSSYYQNVTQWSRGEYSAASQSQDDLAIITSNNGFSYRTDDHGSVDANASPLATVNDVISDWGIIERSNDVDVFAFSTDSGSIQIDVSPLDRGPNLDVLLELYDASSQLVASSNPIETLSAGIQLAATAGQYFLHISGTGNGNPATDGYSDYASLGQYFISGSVVPTDTEFVAVSAQNANLVEGNSGSRTHSFVVSRSGNTTRSTTLDYTVAGVGQHPADRQDFAIGDYPSGSVSFGPGEVSKTILVDVAGDTEVEFDERFAVSLSGATETTVITGSTAEGVIVNDDVIVAPGISVSPTSGLTTRENGNSDSFSVVLDSRPSAEVTISVTSLDATEGLVSTGLLRFTSDNWDQPQSVIVIPVDDSDRDGNVDYTIALSNAQSADPSYAGLPVDDVQVNNQDDEKGRGNGKGKKGNDAKAPSGGDLIFVSDDTIQFSAFFSVLWKDGAGSQQSHRSGHAEDGLVIGQDARAELISRLKPNGQTVLNPTVLDRVHRLTSQSIADSDSQDDSELSRVRGLDALIATIVCEK
ncbi:M12 family metallo-peptidase [Stieleria sp. TO1_6]|uniref:Calx-beta domain-containing protein n=1 Tax=Stieleria tagensis TaxID=2956795 RepID=UPI00209B55B8|nr:M12 family metallo-peptidase [Stieleria tagensis]MCO8121067.1 M12 family metallo-peptidase [Stieleria tagensis]